MTNELAEVIEIAGGPVEDATLPCVVSREQIAENKASILFLELLFKRLLREYGRAGSISIVMTRSSGLTARARVLNNTDAVILIPLGAIARLRVLARLLLRWWGRGRGVLFGNSPLDDIPPAAYDIPPRLISVFGPETEENYWEKIDELDASLELDARFENDVRELLHLAMVYLTSHEFGHVLHRHFDYFEHMNEGRVDVDEVRRGLELHADVFAAETSIKTLFGQVRAAFGEDVAALSRGFLRLSYAATMLYGIYDTHRKFIGAYDEGAYNHPLTRRHLFVFAANRAAAGFSPEAADLWTSMELEGWKRCIDAFQDLNLEALEGKFGKVDLSRAQILQALVYGAGASFPVLQGKLEGAVALLNRTTTQLNAFNASTVRGNS